MRKIIYAACMASVLLSCEKLHDLCPPTTHQTPAGALDFDGQDDEVNLGDWFQYQVFTIQFWAKPGATQNTWTDIMDHEHGDTAGWVIEQNVDNTNEYYMAGGTIILFKLLANEWQQVSCVYDEKTLSVYINGELIERKALEKPIYYEGSHILRLGNWASGGRAWNGQLDEVRFWNRALLQTEIQNNMNCQLTGSENGLIAYYRFNQGYIDADNTSVTSLTDLSGNKHTGTLTNFALTGSRSNWVAGKVTGTCY